MKLQPLDNSMRGSTFWDLNLETTGAQQGRD